MGAEQTPISSTTISPSNVFTYGLLLSPGDRSTPNVTHVGKMPSDARAVNHGLLEVQSSLGQRPRMRIAFEVLVKWRGQKGYKRMRGTSVLVSSPSVEQAQLFIDALRDFAASLSDKWLARPGETPTPGTK